MKSLVDELEQLKAVLGYHVPELQHRLFDKQSASTASHRDLWQRSQDRAAFEKQRAHFSQGRTRREELFNEIERLVGSLKELQTMNDEASKLIQSQSSGRSTNARDGALSNVCILKFWYHARGIFGVVLQAMNCSCPTTHCAELLLTHRTSNDARLDLVFRYSTVQTDNAKAPWDCHRAIISGLKSPGPVTDVVYTATPTLRPKFDGTIKSAFRGSRTPGIAHAVVASASSVNFALAPGLVPSDGNAGTFKGRKDREPLQCNQLTRLKYTMLRHIVMRPCAVRILDRLAPTAPNRAQRYRIAIALASSQLQLHSSAWLSRRWSCNEILFELDANGIPDDDQPRLRAHLTAQETQCFSNGHFDETFASLGILLLELCEGNTLEQSPLREQYRSSSGEPDFIMDRAAASRWAMTIEGNAGPDYADAVHWCLGRTHGPRDQSWRQELRRNVIEPLQELYEPLSSSNERLIKDAEYY
ncbi:hypothetical protein BST61_g303 [Cercospora zeina]